MKRNSSALDSRSSRTPSSTTRHAGADSPATTASRAKRRRRSQKEFAIKLQQHDRPAASGSARAALLPKFRKEAQEELIEERLKLQEAKRIGIEVTDDEVKRVMKGIAERNKMTEEQFAQHLKGLGVDIATMRERIQAQVGLARGRPAARSRR